jgi:hypothetical protein
MGLWISLSFVSNIEGSTRCRKRLGFLTMTYEKKIILKCSTGYKPSLVPLIEAFLTDGVALVATIGTDCEKVEGIIDELVVGDGSNAGRFLTTTSHPDETLEEVIEFVESFSMPFPAQVQIVEL